MYKKTLSGLGFIVFCSIFLFEACSSNSPSAKSVEQNSTQNKTTVSQGNTTNTGNTTQNNSNQASAGKNIIDNRSNNSSSNGELSNKSSDSNPLPSATLTPVNLQSPVPTPTATSSVAGPSGQLNISINPKPPCKRGTPGC
jgi:hypothetical protein